MPDIRLIERWLPIAQIGIESTRERTPMTPFPAPNRLHVWWARRPLVASRAAVLASLLPADADREKFLRVLGIHGDPVAARKKIERARRAGVRVKNPYGYERAFKYSPSGHDWTWLRRSISNAEKVTVLDPTAGGGSIPLETIRADLTSYANDLNPVATLVMKATVEWPSAFAAEIAKHFQELATEWRQQLEERLSPCFPQREVEQLDVTYLWARTVICPYCDGLVPLSPNWRLDPDGTGVQLRPDGADGPGRPGRICSFKIVRSVKEHFPGTVALGNGHCPYTDCGRVIDGDAIKAQAQTERMGEQLFAVVYKRRVPGKILKSGKRGQDKWIRGYRAPRPEDDNGAEILAKLAQKLPAWEALDIVPGEKIPNGNKTSEPQRYGMRRWRDLFSPRQLLGHGTSVEVFREMLDADETAGRLDDIRRAAYGYLALTLDTMLDYNNRASYWDNGTGRGLRHLFNRHDFAFVWSYGEMTPLVAGVGYDWALKKTTKCINELVALIHPGAGGDTGLFDTAGSEPTDRGKRAPPAITITCKPGNSLDHINDGSIDAVVIDPPYGANVMYAELSDFFYVWLKRTAGRLFPELFRRQLTDKENEAVANVAKFQGEKNAGALAGRDYQERMAGVFAECRRVLKPSGIMTVMFTHKETSAWDALATGLIKAGFAITASWPINTESEGGLHIKNKAAAKSTVFLACRPRSAARPANGTNEVHYWEDVAPDVAEAVRKRVGEFQSAGISGVDLFLAAFGPALEEFSRHWPLQRGEPRDRPAPGRGRKTPLLDEPWDPYAVTPEDALDVARREVKRWRLERLTHLKANADLDPTTAFFVLAWDTFRAPVFDYDEALRLSRAVGVDLDRDLTGRLAKKSGSNLTLWDSARRAATGALGPVDGSRGMIDALHHAAHMTRVKSLTAARELLNRAGVDQDPRFFAALEATLEVLPMSPDITGIRLTGDVEAASNDFDALYKLSRLAYSDQVDEPDQLTLWHAGGK